MDIDLATLPLDDSGTVRLGAVSDAALVGLVADALSTPRTVHNSFTLHAPLELLARAELLPIVDPPRRAPARLRLAALGQGFLRAGDPVPPARPETLGGATDAVAALLAAVLATDQDRADAVATWLADRLDAPEVARLLAGPTLRELGAAGHAPILFASYLRVTWADVTPLRGIARQLAEHPDLRVGTDWYGLDHRSRGTVTDFGHALAGLHAGGDPGFGIYLLVAAAHRDGVVRGVPRVAAADTDEAFRELWRVAARSMLDDDPDYAPYGWTHALTMPLGLFQTATLHGGVEESLDLATLLLAGFRHAHGAGPLPEVVGRPTIGPDEDEVAAAASVEHDAHLVKYVLACRHAARLDPGHAALYGEAAAYLVDWWRAHPAADDPMSAAISGGPSSP